MIEKKKTDLREPDLYIWVCLGLGTIFLLLSSVENLGFLTWVGIFVYVLGVVRILMSLNKIFR